MRAFGCIRRPFKNYLKGAVGLFAAMAPKGVDVATLSPADLDALGEHAFERYFESSGLFGTPESCTPMVERLLQDRRHRARMPDRLRHRGRHGARQPSLARRASPSLGRSRCGNRATPRGDEHGIRRAGITDGVALAELWQASLRVDAIGALDNFFDAGGHSLLAMQFANRIRDRFDADITVKDVFHQATLRDLATTSTH